VLSRGLVVWFTGLPAAGKTALAEALRSALGRSQPTELLDGDQVRQTLSPELGYSREDRARHARRVAQLALDLARRGVAVCVAVIAPYAADREEARHLIEAAGIRFVLVFVDASLATRLSRDPRGLYQRALAGNLQGFTGVSAPYEIPDAPDFTVDTDRESIVDAVARLHGQMGGFDQSA
jgi:adenylyl-sulfate kinase